MVLRRACPLKRFERRITPYKVVLEVLSALCEILDIAEQDEELHGDINASRVFIDDVGAVSPEGYGVERAKSDCPEGSLKGPVTDIYGLGRVAYALFTPRDFPELVNDDPDAHDDAVIDAVIQINFDGLPEDMVGDIQWFLCNSCRSTVKTDRMRWMHGEHLLLLRMKLKGS